MNLLRRLVCVIAGHSPIQVREVGLAARPGGMLPALDGYVMFEPDLEGEDTACMRCRTLLT